jgi:hypothetical protein
MSDKREGNSRIVPSWGAYALTFLGLFAGFIWTTFFTAAPYSVFSGAVVGLASAYFLKRVVDKKFENKAERAGKPEIDPTAGGLG